MKKNRSVLATLFLMAVLSVILAFAAKYYYAKERDAYFDRLTGYADQVGQQIRQTFDSDRIYLRSIAVMLTPYDFADTTAAQAMLSSMDTLGGDTGSFSRLELLLPGDQLLTAGGVTDVAGTLSFADEAVAGAHVSSRSADPLNPGQMILHHYVPIEQNGQTVALLCGVVELSRSKELLSITRYNSDIHFCIFERSTGNYLLDSQSNELGTLSAPESLNGQSGAHWEELTGESAPGNTLDLIFRPQNASGNSYCCYAPVGVSDWVLTLTVTSGVALAQAHQILLSFYLMSALLLIVFALYFIWMLRNFQHQRVASERQLRNVRYILDVEKELFDAHTHPEHFTAALQCVAYFLEADTAFLWLPADRLPVEQHFWSSRQADGSQPPFKAFSDFFNELSPLLQPDGCYISYDMEDFCRRFPAFSGYVSARQIHSIMLYPITESSNEPSFILGACNLSPAKKDRWLNAEPLVQVSLSFSMAINHYAAHLTLTKMGQMDTLTGLMNRNSFNLALKKTAEAMPDRLGCVYMDVNGLHEINNRLGHQAGDKMLRTVSDGLCRYFDFPKCGLYRIGGDEFVALCIGESKPVLYEKAAVLRQFLQDRGYELSIGISWQEKYGDVPTLINTAEAAMQKNKQHYYQGNGQSRMTRALDKKLEKTLIEKEDADTFLSVLAPDFKGVYFVDLNSKTLRHLFIPPYFAKILQETNNDFRDAMLLYAERIAKPAYRAEFERLCNFEELESRLDESPELIYQKQDGTWIKLRVLKFKDYTAEQRQTLWIFASTTPPDSAPQGFDA